MHYYTSPKPQQRSPDPDTLMSGAHILEWSWFCEDSSQRERPGGARSCSGASFRFHITQRLVNKPQSLAKLTPVFVVLSFQVPSEILWSLFRVSAGFKIGIYREDFLGSPRHAWWMGSLSSFTCIISLSQPMW